MTKISNISCFRFCWKNEKLYWPKCARTQATCHSANSFLLLPSLGFKIPNGCNLILYNYLYSFSPYSKSLNLLVLNLAIERNLGMRRMQVGQLVIQQCENIRPTAEKRFVGRSHYRQLAAVSTFTSVLDEIKNTFNLVAEHQIAFNLCVRLNLKKTKQLELESELSKLDILQDISID